MGKKVIVFFIFALSALFSGAQTQEGGLIEGDTWAFLISAPQGWVWDSVALRHQGIKGLFYKEGSRFSPSELHMYISPTRKEKGGPSGLDEFIQADEAAFMKTDSGNRARILAPYSPGMDYNFAIRDFDDPAEKFYQSIAYYEGEDAFFVMVLFCRSEQDRDRERASFLELLDSFTYIRKE